MSDFDKKKKTEEDPIQVMLERLRKIVDTPVEKIDFSDSEKTSKTKRSPAAQKPKKKAAEPKPTKEAPAKDEPVAEEVAEPTPVAEVSEEVAEEVAEPAPVAEAAEEVAKEVAEGVVTPAAETEEELFFAEADGEEDGEDEEEPASDEESEIDEKTLFQFFTAEEDEPAAPAKDEPAAEEAKTPEDDGREYDLLTFDDISVFDDSDDKRDNSWKEAIVFPKREDAPAESAPAEPVTPDVFSFAQFEEEPATPVAEEPVFEQAPAVEDIVVEQRSADWLFRPRDFHDSLSEETVVPDTDPSEEPAPVEANEENGYAVEVTVNLDQKPWFAPTVPEEKSMDDVVFPTKVLVHEMEEEAEAPASQGPVPTEEAETAAEPSFFVYPKEDVIDTVDVDDTDDLEIPRVMQNPPTAEVAEDTPADGGEEEGIRSFSWESVPPKTPTEEKKRSLRASFASFFRGEGTDGKKQRRGVFFSAGDREEDAPEALSGIYNEAGADYHEYTSRNQIGLFSGRFVALISSCTVRVIALAFLCTLLLLLEDLRYLGVTLGGFFARPGGMAGAHLLLMIFVILCCIPMLSHAWRHLFNNRVLPEAYLAIGLVCALFYDVFLLLASVPSPYLFGLVPAVGALILSIIDLLKTKGDFSSFKLVSSSGDKLACSVACGAETKSEAVAVSDLEEGTDTRILSVKKVGFAAGFFHRISRICEDGRKNLWLLVMALVSSLATAIVCGILIGTHVLPQNGSAAIYAFCVTLSFSFPICSLLLHKLPAVQLFARAASTRCAVVGEVSALEYCDAAAVAFEDVEAFPARNVRVQRIKLYGDAALDHVLYRVAGLFSAVGGPLDGVFRSSTAEVGLSAEVRLLRAEEGGIIASVDGHEVCVGRGEYMLSRNIHMYYDPEDEQNLLGGKVNIMYAAEDGRLIAKFYVRYKMDEDFERDVEELHRHGIRTIIRTYDPNITEALVAGISYTERFDVRVVRKTVDQQNDFAADRLNSGIVCKTSCRDILRTLFACRRMCQVIRIAENGNLLVACFGILLSLFLCAFGVIFSVPSILLALYQLLWVGLIALCGKLYI